MSNKRPGRGRAEFNANQLQIDWNGVTSTPPVDSAEESNPQERIKAVATTVRPPVADPEPVLRLRWDFRTRFPEPLPEVVYAGTMSAEDVLPESVEQLHQEHGRRMLGVLSDLDAAMDARRNRPSAVRSSADTLTEPTRLERWYSSLLGVYEDWFGREAAEAFDRAVRAWHAHIEVVVDRHSAGGSDAIVAPPTDSSPSRRSTNVPTSCIDAEVCEPLIAPAPASNLPAVAQRRIIARSPVPRPRAAAVVGGHFGRDERGKPIDPSADEVDAITRDHAERLIRLMESLKTAGASAASALDADIRAGLATYAEDFGERAAQQLEAYCRLQARVRDRDSDARGR